MSKREKVVNIALEGLTLVHRVTLETRNILARELLKRTPADCQKYVAFLTLSNGQFAKKGQVGAMALFLRQILPQEDMFGDMIPSKGVTYTLANNKEERLMEYYGFHSMAQAFIKLKELADSWAGLVVVEVIMMDSIYKREDSGLTDNELNGIQISFRLEP